MARGLSGPRTSDDCPACCAAAAAPPPAPAIPVAPYSQLKSRRGGKKVIPTAGFACRYFNHTDPAIHALVGYGQHGHHAPIQDFWSCLS